MKPFLPPCNLLALLIASVLGLLACTSDTETASVSFTVFGDPAEFAAYQALAVAFEAAHPDISLELRHIPSQADYRRRLAADFASGDPTDVMLLNYRRFATFAEAGGLEPLGPYLENSSLLKEADFYPVAIESFYFQDELWCIPQNLSSLVVYYNQDLFDAAGLPYPSDDWTQADFLQTARTLTLDTDGDGSLEQYGAGINPNLFRLAPFIWQAGGSLVDDPAQPSRLALDSPAAQAAFAWFVSLQVEEKVVPSASAEASLSSENRFLNGTLAMYFNSRRGVPTYRTIEGFRWDVAPLPRGEQAASILHSDAYCLAAATENKAAAWTFIEFANSIEGQTIVARSGRTVPSLVEVAESPAFLDPELPPANSRIYLDTAPILGRVPIMSGWVGVEETASEEIERAFYGTATLEEATEAAIRLTKPFFDSTADR